MSSGTVKFEFALIVVDQTTIDSNVCFNTEKNPKRNSSTLHRTIYSILVSNKRVVEAENFNMFKVINSFDVHNDAENPN